MVFEFLFCLKMSMEVCNVKKNSYFKLKVQKFNSVFLYLVFYFVASVLQFWFFEVLLRLEMLLEV